MLKSLPYKLSGNENSENLIVFLHGWPDNISLWDRLIDILKFDCLCVSISYPNYDLKSENKWGYDFPEIITALKTTLKEFDNLKTNKILVAHDWGCIYSYIFDKKYPGYFNNLIALDVSPKLDLKFSIIYYQLALVLAFLISGKIGDKITNYFAKKMGFRGNLELKSFINYQYYYFWKNLLRAKMGLEKHFLEKYKPSFPIIYIYAIDKPFQFQTESWKKFIENKKDSKFIGLKGGHWIMHKHKNTIIELIREKLKKISKI